MQEQSKSVFRLSFLLKMIEIEAEYQKQLGIKHKAKYEFSKMINAVQSGFRNIKNDLKISGEKFSEEIANSEEKINAMHNILTTLADLPEDAVLEIEKSFDDLKK